MDELKDDDDIQGIFDEMAQKLGDGDEGVKAMFAMLVKGALKYRDHLVATKGVPLRVKETREAIDAFMIVMKTHQLPSGLNETVKGLVVTWLQEIKNLRHN